MPDTMTDTIETVETPAETVETPAETVETPAEWDGSLDTLDKQPWWQSVPEKAREAIAGWKTQGDLVRTVLEADDSLAEMARQLETREKEVEGLRKSLGETESAYRKLSEDIAEQAADREFEALKAKYADIFDDIYDPQGNKVGADYDGDLGARGAYMRFLLLRNSGIDDEEAATMARALLPKAAPAPVPAPKAEPPPAEALPKSLRAASAGGGTPPNVVSAKRRDENIEAALARLKAEADAEGWG